MEGVGSPAQSLGFTGRKEEKRGILPRSGSSGSSRSHFHSRPSGKNMTNVATPGHRAGWGGVRGLGGAVFSSRATTSPTKTAGILLLKGKRENERWGSFSVSTEGSHTTYTPSLLCPSPRVLPPPPPSRSPFSGVQVRLLSCLLPASMLLSLRAFVSVAPPALEAPLGHSHSGSLTSFRPKVTPRGWS